VGHFRAPIHTPGRGAVHARDLLKEFRGTIQVDGYSAYETLAAERNGDLRLANCWSHARREFYDLYKPDGSTPVAAEACGASLKYTRWRMRSGGAHLTNAS